MTTSKDYNAKLVPRYVLELKFTLNVLSNGQAWATGGGKGSAPNCEVIVVAAAHPAPQLCCAAMELAVGLAANPDLDEANQRWSSRSEALAPSQPCWKEVCANM